MLGLYRALKKGYDFTLDTNIPGVGAFDDVVFTYKEKDGIGRRIYFQQKHSEREDDGKKIVYRDLLKSGNADFALYKYFIDYLDIIRNFDEKNKIKSQYFIIYTNVDFNCRKADADGLRIHKKSNDEYFKFRKLDSSKHKPLELFSIFDSGEDEKCPAFYQFDQNDEGEKTRVISVLKNEFKTIDKKDHKLTISENELESRLEGFLSTLIFAVDQFDQEMLGNLIKEEIEQDDALSQFQVNRIFEYALSEIGQWKLRREPTKPLTESNDFFRQGRENIMNDVAVYPSLVYKNKLSNYDVRIIQEKYKELNNFISSGKKLWLISSRTSWLHSLAIYQALNEETLKKETSIDYANNDCHLFLTWKDLLDGYERILLAFEAKGQSLLIIACDLTDTVNDETINEKIGKIVEKITKIVSGDASNLKQVIVIVPESYELSKQLKQSLISSYRQDYKIEFRHLTPESQETCFKTQKIRFQGKDELFSIQQLLDLGEQFPVSEEILNKLNLGESELEILLKSPVVEIGSEHPKLSYLDSAHYKTYAHIELEQLKSALKANPKDIFAFVAKKNGVEVENFFTFNTPKVLLRFEDGLPPVKNGGSILLKADEEEEQFKQLCCQVDEIPAAVTTEQPALHLLKERSEWWMWTRTYCRDFYMRRSLYAVLVDDKKLKDLLIKEPPSSDYFVFSGTEEDELLELLQIITVNETDNFRINAVVLPEEAAAQEVFDHLCNQNWKSIHWLKVKLCSKQLRWCRSHGEVSQVRRVLLNKEAVKTPLCEAKLAKSTERVVVLADEPGMGKTTTLTRVAELMKKQKPQTWVVKIDLIRHQVVLVSKQVETVENLVDLLSRIDKKLDDPLTRRMFIYLLKCPGHVNLLWDGFDEVKSERQEAVLSLFEFIKKDTAATVWITTCRQDQKKLEGRLSVLAHQFECLDEAMQIDFLGRFWATILKLTVENPDISTLKSYAKEVIESFEQSIQTYEADRFFISIPLRARMVAEMCKDEVKKAVMENKPLSGFLEANKRLTMENLYENFIERKYDIYLCEKAGIGEGLDEESKNALKSCYTEAYCILAMQKAFDRRKTENFIRDKNIKFSFNTLSRIGLIQENEEPVNFIHRTFVEYFAAKWLAAKAKKLEVKKFLGVQLFKKESRVLRRFFDRFLTQNLPLHRIVLKGDTSFEDIDITDINKKDELGRTALHLAAQEGLGVIVEYLQEACDDKLAQDQTGKTALHYAACCRNGRIFHQLIENYIDIDLEDHIFRTPLHLDSEVGNSIFNKPEFAKSVLLNLVNAKDEAGRTPLLYAADNMNWYTACLLLLHGADVSALTIEQKRELLRFTAEQTEFFDDSCLDLDTSLSDFENCLWPILGLLLIQVPEAVQELYDICKYPRLLWFFFQYGHTKVIDAVLRSIEDEQRRLNIVNYSRYSYSPLSRISSISMSDEYVFSDTDYLKIVKYFYEQGRELQIEINEERAREFLCSAANHGFLETFRYLFEYAISERSTFNLRELQSNKAYIKILFSNIQDIKYNNPWLRKLISASYQTFGWTQLHLAAMNKNVNSVEDFFSRTTYKNINSRDSDGYTPLACAASTRGKSRFIQSLFVALKTRGLKNKNKLYNIVNTKDNINRRTPLHWVTYNGDLDSAKVLLKNIKDIGFDQKQLFNIINSRDYSNSTPLEYIFSFRFSENIAEFLKLFFVYINFFNFTSQQCVEILIGNDNLLYRLIWAGLEKEAVIVLDGIESLALEDTQRTEIVSGHYVAENNNTLLHEAARKGNCCEIILSLLKNGAVYNAYNDFQKTPLDIFNERKRLRKSLQEASFVQNSADEAFHTRKKVLETEYVLNTVNRLFELTADEKLILVAEKLDELKEIISEINAKTWIDPKSILNARNRDGKTLLDLSTHEEVTNLLQKLTRYNSTRLTILLDITIDEQIIQFTDKLDDLEKR